MPFGVYQSSLVLFPVMEASHYGFTILIVLNGECNSR